MSSAMSTGTETEKLDRKNFDRLPPNPEDDEMPFLDDGLYETSRVKCACGSCGYSATTSNLRTGAGSGDKGTAGFQGRSACQIEKQENCCTDTHHDDCRPCERSRHALTLYYTVICIMRDFQRRRTSSWIGTNVLRYLEGRAIQVGRATASASFPAALHRPCCGVHAIPQE